jgi:hypothetical protein
MPDWPRIAALDMDARLIAALAEAGD